MKFYIYLKAFPASIYRNNEHASSDVHLMVLG